MSSLAALMVLAIAQSGSISAPMTETGQLIRQEEQARLEACLEKVQSDPEGAYEDGLAWLSNGNRPPARKCVATALVALEHYMEAADRLVALANAPDAGSLDARAGHLAQAGNAYLLAGAPEPALKAFDSAIELGTGRPSLLVDRATAQLQLGQPGPAVDDLSRALEVNPDQVDALRLRAEAYLQLERHDDALADVAAARDLAPGDIDLLVLRGDIREAQRLAASDGPDGAPVDLP